MKMRDNNESVLEEKLGYNFKNRKLLRNALNHSSFVNEEKMPYTECNERLEFLGDAVLDLIVGEFIYSSYTEMTEGEMTKLRASVVCEQNFARQAKALELNKYLYMSHGEEMGDGSSRVSTMSDTFEALVGAVYRDCDFEETRRIVLRLLENDILQYRHAFDGMDFKTKLQEIIQKKSKNLISYRVISESGLQHDKVFEVQVEHDNKILGKGTGKSKKEAEQGAASDALANISCTQ